MLALSKIRIMHKILNEENIRRHPNDKLNVHTIMILLQIKEEVQC